jgi:Disulfide bond formation protein DsbB
LVAAGQLVAVCVVLLGSLTYQFVLGELTCPLCVIQRMAFLLACVGPIGILLRAAEGRSDGAPEARGFGMTILASLVGAAASIRQILLHIVPRDPGYGPPVSWVTSLFLGAHCLRMPDRLQCDWSFWDSGISRSAAQSSGLSSLRAGCDDRNHGRSRSVLHAGLQRPATSRSCPLRAPAHL